MIWPSNRHDRQGAYPPWEVMLSIDAVNYNPSEQLAVTRRLGVAPTNIASGVSYYPAPTMPLHEVARAISHPAFHRDYDGPQGHLLGIRAIQTYELFASRHGVELSDDHVMLTHGASMGIYLLALYFADQYPGCEVLLPVPTFPLAGASMAFAGVRVKEVTHAGDRRMLPTLREYEAAASKATRLIFLNIFNNPTGESYDQRELSEILRWARQERLYVIVDKISLDMALEREAPNALDVAHEEQALANLIIISSLSKDRSLPGLRVGWIIAVPRLIAELTRYNALISMASLSPMAALLFVDMLCRAVQEQDSHCGWSNSGTVAARFIDHTRKRSPLAPDLDDFLAPYLEADHLETLLAQHFQWHAGLQQLLVHNWHFLAEKYGTGLAFGAPCHGGFNTFVHVGALDHVDPYRFTTTLFRERGTQILPGPVFGGKPDEWRAQRGFWTRLSFAMETEKLDKGLAELFAFAEDYREW